MTDMSIQFEFEIDLNMLEGEHVTSHLDNLSDNLRRRERPEMGETVLAVDEDGARYLAVVQFVDDDGFVELCIKRESRMRPPTFDVTPLPNVRPVKAVFGSATRPASVTPSLSR